MSKELANYLKSKVGLNRLLIKLKDKYISLGRYSGTVELEKITPQEAEDLSNFLGRTIKPNTKIKISYREIEKKLQQTKYREYSWKEVFHNYFNETLITKKQEQFLKQESEITFFKKLIDKNKKNKYIDKLKIGLKEGSSIYPNLKQRFYKDSQELENTINNILLLLENIPVEPQNLAVYASITGNPHFLDFNTSTSHLFFKILCFILDKEEPKETFQKIELLSEINIYTDALSNYVITYGLCGSLLIENFYNNHQSLNLNLENLLNIEQVDTQQKRVYIFENPSMLMALKDLEEAIIITSGIPNLAVYRLLDKLVASHNTLYYNGDFDPEGLLIAEILKKRYPELILFDYTKEDYVAIRSKEYRKSSRLKKLSKVNSQELSELKNCLLKERYSAYQEKNIIKIREYMKTNRK